MNDGDTSMGGVGQDFPDTTWGLITCVRDRETPIYCTGLETLSRRYWKPVYRYIRMVWAKSNEDAKDLTQAFFLWVVDGDALERYAPERGSFRLYLKVLLKGFLGHQERALCTLKRGGGIGILRLDEEEFRDALADPKATDPEKSFDREWAGVVLKLAVERVRERFARTGRESHFRVYEEIDLASGGEERTRADAARRLGLTENEVRYYLADARREIGEEILRELRELTTNTQELKEEWNALFE